MSAFLPYADVLHSINCDFLHAVLARPCAMPEIVFHIDLVVEVSECCEIK